MNAPTALPAYRRKLNPQQLALLKCLYKFRFCNSKQLAQYLERPNHKAIQKRLQILEEQSFIGKRYNSSYKLKGRSAEYYLTPKGSKYIADTDPKIIKSLYRNKSVSLSFINHCLAITDVALKIWSLYGRTLEIRTRTAFIRAKHFPNWLPDLVLTLHIDNSETYAFVDVWTEDQPFFVSVRKIKNYQRHIDDVGWPSDKPEAPFLFSVCANVKNQKKLNRAMAKTFARGMVDDYHSGYTITMDKLMEADNRQAAHWLMMDGADKPVLFELNLK